MNVFRLMLFITAGVLLSACGESDDHGHEHDAEGGHSNEAAAEEHGHEHGDNTHAHDAPETEPMYGDEAESAADATAVESEPHEHGADTHTHEEPAEHDAAAEEEHSHDDEPPHDHDH